MQCLGVSSTCFLFIVPPVFLFVLTGHLLVLVANYIKIHLLITGHEQAFRKGLEVALVLWIPRVVTLNVILQSLLLMTD